MQIPIVNGITTDGGAPDFRTSYPRNLIPVPKSQGISDGYLRPAEGVQQVGVGPGADRGGINWNGVLYRVMGTKLCQVARDGTVTVLGDVGAGGPVTMDYSFDRLGIASGGRLWFWDGSSLSAVTDPDLGYVLDAMFIAGYWMTTDGTYLIVTDLGNQSSVSPLHYGSSEASPDPIKGVGTLRNEAYAFNRYTIEVFQNVVGVVFPYQRVEGAQVNKGIIGTHAVASLGDTFIFLGSGKGEAPAVYVMTPGNVQKVSTREIDQMLEGYTEDQLAGVVMELRVSRNHQTVLMHLPDQCWAYDTIGSQAAQEPLWYGLDSGTLTPSQYRARGIVWCYDRWNVGDPTSAGLIGTLATATGDHYGQAVGWGFGTQIAYGQGQDGIFHELELVCLTGRIALGADPVIWTQHSTDGMTWSQPRQARAGRQGQRNKRIAWRGLGRIHHWRVQRFWGTTDAHLSFARLEAQIEPLFTKRMAGNG